MITNILTWLSSFNISGFVAPANYESEIDPVKTVFQTAVLEEEIIKFIKQIQINQFEDTLKLRENGEKGHLVGIYQGGILKAAALTVVPVTKKEINKQFKELTGYKVSLIPKGITGTIPVMEKDNKQVAETAAA